VKQKKRLLYRKKNNPMTRLKKDKWGIGLKQNGMDGQNILMVKLPKSTMMVHLVLRLMTEKKKDMSQKSKYWVIQAILQQEKRT
tara:strand:+ start:56 stop:307 length:252 start_codon:yes stop_codon:yes gene_type:complete